MRPVGSKYLLEEPLGRGATGTVWRARMRDDAASLVAIKVLREELATDPDVVMRFLRERSVLLRLVHPNVVRVRDLVVEGEVLALVMDLVEGPDLFRYLRDNGPLSPVAAALLMAQVADALAASHADGVVHRDLKPANVLLATEQTADGPLMRPLLTDFGIARLADSPGITRTHEFVGTPTYVAPETAEGREQTSAVDVYGAGIMLYELVTGRPPFRGDGPVQTLQAHLQQEPERPRNLPEPLWTVIDRSLRKAPAERPSAASLATALRTVAAGVGVHATVAQIEAANMVAYLLTPPQFAPGTGALPFPGSSTPTLAGAGAFGAPADPTQVLPGSGGSGAGAFGALADATQAGMGQGAVGGFGAPADPTQVLPGPGGSGAGAFGAPADPTQVLPGSGGAGAFGAAQGGSGPGAGAFGATQGGTGQGAGGGFNSPADATQVLPGSGGAAGRGIAGVNSPLPEQGADGRDLWRQPGGGAEGTRVMPAGPGVADGQQGPHPWESQLQAARTRNEQTQVAWLPPEPDAGVAPPPYHAPQSGAGGRPVSAAQARREAQVAPAPYRPAPPQPERRDPVADPTPAPRSAPAPERRREPAPDRDYDREPERRERAPRRPRRRMHIPGSGCLKFLLILVVAGFLVWQFSPLHGWIDHAVRTVEGWWHGLVNEYHKITGTVDQVNKTVKTVKSGNG